MLLTWNMQNRKGRRLHDFFAALGEVYFLKVLSRSLGTKDY